MRYEFAVDSTVVIVSHVGLLLCPKSFPKLADLPLPVLRAAPISAGELKQHLHLSLKHLLQNEVEGMELTQLKNHIISNLRPVIIGDS
jgi:hypothetical protein